MTKKPVESEISLKKPQKETFTLNIDAELKRKASEKAQEMGLNLSQVMRFLLDEWVKSKQQKMFF